MDQLFILLAVSRRKIKFQSCFVFGCALFNVLVVGTVRPGLKGPPVSRSAIVISRSPFLLFPNVALFCEIS